MVKCYFIAFVFFSFLMQASGQIEEALNAAINSDHWENYFCEDEKGEKQLSVIYSNNVLPILEGIALKGRPIPMRVQIPKGEAFVLKIKSCKIKLDHILLRFIYDERVKIRMKLIKNEWGEWQVENSMFRQKLACGGKKEKRGFSWTF